MKQNSPVATQITSIPDAYSVALPATSRADLESVFGLLSELIPSVPRGPRLVALP